MTTPHMGNPRFRGRGAQLACHRRLLELFKLRLCPVLPPKARDLAIVFASTIPYLQ